MPERIQSMLTSPTKPWSSTTGLPVALVVVEERVPVEGLEVRHARERYTRTGSTELAFPRRIDDRRGSSQMGTLEGRVAVITGAGRGIGREHALLFATRGRQGRGERPRRRGGRHRGPTPGPAQQVVEEIKAMGGEAVANTDSCADWEGGQRLIQTAIDTFGELHVLVNNAGILRDRMLTNMSEAEWDTVINVHLKGHFVPLHFAAVLLARAGEGGHAGEGVGDQHVVDVGPVRQRRPDQLRRGQDRHRDAGDHRPDGARPLRRARRTRSLRRR